ncbi:MAG: 1-deoxy-D-xylulose-5-phosphate reductoisomerase [Candidatus Marinimicrobia bacterium]|jgi:1-deoxy-D-xylulose-5-phosphate reductoisomerase|nr:1-deoxy-D-xylulose-5-phosphate reductoisomerase [Candidatus Neomarinimicrobiota bacterium]MBT3675183.1 1-deoxy-D-xylulose-5-phosphate reductoisomerase [Candidatus Neomarinimicrobiota bacterium]MBT3763893.1 1-deoxy-D-xylulose-5-phosphate reductoisomerase [Candidatus Neomarinimicrobiota bacterium]MBT4068638.1 1-deoxy-D-xylulose-5-phosphate reductoisomerase [Candidatus Neomarinimicrobiota bacterium]MBT4271340.1 1-deoxy-D-xylulose-5-phosphate reductoisomerase [Candidatus Neomarinimicrobiota bact
MKKISILGSTGSIGVNALNVIDNLGDEFDVSVLSANKNGQLLVDQAIKYRPDAVAIIDDEAAKYVQSELKESGVSVFKGREGLLELASQSDLDIMLNGLVGSSGMAPTLNAVKAGVDVALSNKESLVMAGDIIEQEKLKSGAKVFPVDSEHSAIWQCLAGESMDDIEQIILTGSGGPFRRRNIKTFKDVTPADALKHPNWDMGRKITIDSATMMNKGLEVIETRWLFGLGAEKIDIVVHPQSIIHSMVEFKDKSVKAQLGIPDMKVPIQYALTYPRHAPAMWESLDLVKVGSLTFEAPDLTRFPCIGLAYNALKQGGTASAILNVANEQSVYRFLDGEIGFMEIPEIIEKACDAHEWVEHPSLEELLNLESWGMNFVNLFESRYI